MKKILLVDDDMATLKGLQMCFGSKNFPTISATNVSAAKQLFDTEEISLVCTDWDLPGGKTGTGHIDLCEGKKHSCSFSDGT